LLLIIQFLSYRYNMSRNTFLHNYMFYNLFTNYGSTQILSYVLSNKCLQLLFNHKIDFKICIYYLLCYLCYTYICIVQLLREGSWQHDVQKYKEVAEWRGLAHMHSSEPASLLTCPGSLTLTSPFVHLGCLP